MRDEMDCQKEKSVAISLDEVTGVIPEGKAWSLEQPFQIIRIGQIAIIALPTEVSVMSGRRIEAELASVLLDVKHIAINANSNSTNLYLTTRQEYASQQYEGGASLMARIRLTRLRKSSASSLLRLKMNRRFRIMAYPSPRWKPAWK